MQKEDKAVAVAEPASPQYTREQVDLYKRLYCKGTTDDECMLYLAQCKRTGLDPAARQIFAIKRWDSRERREVMQIQVSIDGFRLVAERTGKYEGQTEPEWCGKDGQWTNAWTPDDPPVLARVGVYKTGCRGPIWGVARFSEYQQLDRDGHVMGLWRKMPATMLSKCAEAQALRKGFPQEMSGLYTGDELPEPAAVEEKAAEERPWQTFKQMIERFQELKRELGDDKTYYEVLASYSVKHANEFTQREQALDAYHALKAAVQNFPPAQPETK